MCKQTCIEGTDRILCIICSNWFHFDCTNISKKTFDKIKSKAKQFTCQICKTKTKCYQCECSLSAYKNQLYCIVCLRKYCATCHTLEKSDLNLYKNTDKAYLCKECSIDHFYPSAKSRRGIAMSSSLR